MNFFHLITIAVGLSMDAFAAAVCKGISLRGNPLRPMLICGIFFGGFQALMLAVGWAMGTRFRAVVEGVDHWIAFCLLTVVGINMMRQSQNQESTPQKEITLGEILPLALATSLDAMAVGITFACIHLPVVTTALAIGLTTGGLSALGVWVGVHSFKKYRSLPTLFGGLVLVFMGMKFLLEHLF